MRCYFLLKGHIAAVEILTGPSDEEAIAEAQHLFSQRRRRFEAFEVWDRKRMLFRHPDPHGDSADLLGLDAASRADRTALLAQRGIECAPGRIERSGEEQKRSVSDQNRPPVYLVTLFHKSGNAGEAIRDSAELESVYDDFDAEKKAWDWVNQKITAECTSFNISKNGSLIGTFPATPV